MARTPPPRAQTLAVLALAAALPLASLLGHPGACLADPLSELPVKLWAHERFWRGPLLGGHIPDIGHPHPGALNNPDLTSTVALGLLRPLLGEPAAYNLLIWAQLLAAMGAAFALFRALCGDARAAWTGAIAFALTPMVLVYAVMGAITDMLSLWPYPLALLAGLRAVQGGRPLPGLAAGALLGIGLWTCPYNFVVFSIAAPPLVIWLALAWKGGLLPAEVPARPPTRALPGVVLAVALGLALFGGSSALALHAVMSDEDSQVSARVVADTRHHPPYEHLRPGAEGRYTARLDDYLRVGKDGLVVRELGSRYHRAFSPGLTVLGLSAAGLWGWRRRWRAVSLWPALALWAALASLGPYPVLAEGLAAARPWNPVWLGLHHLWPGADLLLEPFRYALVVAVSLAACASLGVAWLAERWGGWVRWAAPGLVLAELVVLSPVPVPLPVHVPEVPPLYGRLDALLPPGAILELPYTRGGSGVFNREHFLHQRAHGRPIPDVVIGFFPEYLVQNAFTARLLFEEAQRGPLVMDHPDPRGVDEGLARLAEDGFAGVIVTPSRYADERTRDRVRMHLAALGPPLEVDGRLIYRVPPPAR